MKRHLVMFIVPVFLTGIFFTAFAQDSVWVSSSRAKIQADRSASSDVVAKPDTGTKLTVLAYEDRWYRVRTPGGDEGWIYRGRVSKEPPVDETGGDTGNLLSSLGGSSIAADEADTARSIRGLSKETETYAKNTGTPEKYQEALDEVLAMKVTEGEIEAFLKNGKIGEYAE
jgi:uncharacterized protein YgiM (DUF1202 family)